MLKSVSKFEIQMSIHLLGLVIDESFDLITIDRNRAVVLAMIHPYSFKKVARVSKRERNRKLR